MVRSELRLRERPHLHPARSSDQVIEVLRDGKVVATIYGSREGVHIVSDRLAATTSNRPFFLQPAPAPMPGYVIPLLASDEVCPWCAGGGVIALDENSQPCPVCKPPR